MCVLNVVKGMKLFMNKYKKIIFTFIIIIILGIIYVIFNEPQSKEHQTDKKNDNKDSQVIENIEFLDGSASAYFFVDSLLVSYARYPVYHTIKFNSDLTCEMEKLKQLDTESSYAWPPDDPYARWRYVDKLEDTTYDVSNINLSPCYYAINNIKGVDYVFVLAGDKLGAYKIVKDEDNYVEYLQQLMTGNEKYYFSYKVVNNESKEVTEKEIEKEKKKYIGTWTNREEDLVINEDGKCSFNYTEQYIDNTTNMIDPKYVYKTDCTWRPEIGKNEIYVEYTYHEYVAVYEKYRIFKLKDNSTTLNEIVAGEITYNGVYEKTT